MPPPTPGCLPGCQPAIVPPLCWFTPSLASLSLGGQPPSGLAVPPRSQLPPSSASTACARPCLWGAEAPRATLESRAGAFLQPGDGAEPAPGGSLPPRRSPRGWQPSLLMGARQARWDSHIAPGVAQPSRAPRRSQKSPAGWPEVAGPPIPAAPESSPPGPGWPAGRKPALDGLRSLRSPLDPTQASHPGLRRAFHLARHPPRTCPSRSPLWLVAAGVEALGAEDPGLAVLGAAEPPVVPASEGRLAPGLRRRSGLPGPPTLKGPPGAQRPGPAHPPGLGPLS